jgi:hypothetical protein
LTISSVLNYVLVMTRNSQLMTVADVIDAFGGLRAMCDIFGGQPSRFCNHKASGRFPKHMHMEIYTAACERKLNIAPELIGMTRREPQRELPLQAAE